MFRVPESKRIKNGPYRTDKRHGNNGACWIKLGSSKKMHLAIASDKCGWEHVSISRPGVNYCPSWDVMQSAKLLFWSAEDLVVQFHPPEKSYKNFHPYCLHLWRVAGSNDYVRLPPDILV